MINYKQLRDICFSRTSISLLEHGFQSLSTFITNATIITFLDPQLASAVLVSLIIVSIGSFVVESNQIQPILSSNYISKNHSLLQNKFFRDKINSALSKALFLLFILTFVITEVALQSLTLSFLTAITSVSYTYSDSWRRASYISKNPSFPIIISTMHLIFAVIISSFIMVSGENVSIESCFFLITILNTFCAIFILSVLNNMRVSNTLTTNRNYYPEIEHLSHLRLNYFGSVALAESTLNVVIVIFFQSALVEITSIRTISGIFSPLLNSIRTNLISNVQLNATGKSETNNSSKLFKNNTLVYLLIFLLMGMFGAFLFSRYSMIPAGTFNNTLVKSIPLGYLLAFLTFLYEATKARFYIAQYARNVMFSVIMSSIVSLSIANAYSSYFAYILIFCNPILCAISMVLLNFYHKLNEGD